MKMNNVLKITKQTIILVIKASPLLFLVNMVLSVVYSFSGIFIVFSTQKLFEKIEYSIHRSSLPSDFLIIFVIFCLAFFLKEVLGGLSNYIASIFSNKCIMRFSELMHHKTAKIDPENFENPELFDIIENADNGIYSAEYYVTNLFNLFLYDIPYLLFIGLYLFFLKPLLFFIPILIFIPVIITQILRTSTFIKYRNEKAPIERRIEHYKNCIIDPHFFKETRSLGSFMFFKNLFILNKNISNIMTWRIQNRSQFINFISKVITLCGNYCGLLLLIVSLMNGDITISIFAAVFTIMQQIYTIVEHIVCNRLGQIIMDDYTSIYSFVQYMNLPERHFGEINISIKKNISLKDVAFKYYGRNDYAIESINLEIKEGETIAIVGENGSGKTTLARLLLGIYKPIKGEIMINGTLTKELTKKSLFSFSSAVFQNYYRYLFKLAENISISQAELSRDYNKLDSACNKAQINSKDKMFIDGYDTMLSKQFNGIDISGGEWQRVALARGYYRDSDLIVLDEPTASIDPIEESRIYNSFINNSENKITIIITHRLGSTKNADRIIVMNKGHIEQIGKHNELIMVDGVYKKLFNSQAKWY